MYDLRINFLLFLSVGVIELCKYYILDMRDRNEANLEHDGISFYATIDT